VTLVKKIRAGLLDQMSFAFKVTKQTWSDDYTQRRIQAVDLSRGDVSVVNFGASPTTSVDARARRHGTAAPASLYQARARALALRTGRPPAPPIGSRDWMIWARNEVGRRS
jgi:phage head maturation protease